MDTKHGNDVTLDDFNTQGITVISDKKTITIKAKAKPKDIRTALSVIVK